MSKRVVELVALRHAVQDVSTRVVDADDRVVLRQGVRELERYLSLLEGAADPVSAHTHEIVAALGQLPQGRGTAAEAALAAVVRLRRDIQVLIADAAQARSEAAEAFQSEQQALRDVESSIEPLKRSHAQELTQVQRDHDTDLADVKTSHELQLAKIAEHLHQFAGEVAP